MHMYKCDFDCVYIGIYIFFNIFVFVGNGISISLYTQTVRLTIKLTFNMSGFSYPFWPGFGALLLNVRVCLCLNLGGPFLGVVGPAVLPGARALPAGGALFISAEGL